MYIFAYVYIYVKYLKVEIIVFLDKQISKTKLIIKMSIKQVKQFKT